MHFLLMHVQKSVGKYKMDTQQLPLPPKKAPHKTSGNGEKDGQRKYPDVCVFNMKVECKICETEKKLNLKHRLLRRLLYSLCVCVNLAKRNVIGRERESEKESV